MSPEEKEFLKNYDPSQFDQLSMTTDVLLISISSKDSNNYRKNDEKRMSILLEKRDNFPEKGRWCLPGGFLKPKEETLEECARRVLKQETNFPNIYLEQLYTFDRIDRDPRTRVVSTSFVALIDKNRIKEKKMVKNTSWFDITSIEEKNNLVTITLSNEEETLKIKVKRKESAFSREQYEVQKEKTLAFDHDAILLCGMERIRNKINYTDIVFHMMPEVFTLKELQSVYEVLLNKKLLDPAFRRIIKNKVEKTKEMKTGGGHRPSSMYRYKKNESN